MLQIKTFNKIVPFAERIAGARIFAARLQVSSFLDEHVECTATPILLRFATFHSVFPIAFLLRRVRRHEFQPDDYLAFIRDRIVERFRLQTIVTM